MRKLLFCEKEFMFYEGGGEGLYFIILPNYAVLKFYGLDEALEAFDQLITDWYSVA